MTARPITPEDYPTLCQWWTGHAWDSPPLAALPHFGAIVPGHAAAYLFCDPSASAAMMEFIVANPANTPMQTARAIVEVSALIEAIAIQLGKTALFTSCQQSSLAGLLVKTRDFHLTDTSMIHLLKPLHP